ncbi:hypothetical protein [Sedimentitalea todarodis]|uniref:Uncharacterized protein n=1 Tax=Sedimentitalea todarodis TaxID=1631240 RepID=A0ABU3VB60_9RHOB|nr:hypothetical protein [Sedimentitalea todarodis]MDU9003410.1 hypothetical protein [Sedimentitalea todarodis]
MFGVVLWCDEEDHKAVIWCEDHGDLAFYRSPSEVQSVSMDAGDWVEFDLSMDRNMRFAHNPRLIAEGVFPELPESLETVGNIQVSPAAQAQKHRGSAEIIPFAATLQSGRGQRRTATASRA